ncbi:MAG: recombinase family protein [Pseudonocardiales bacterium]|nr:recombinase family protein [Pseudonocardiales bacterium]
MPRSAAIYCRISKDRVGAGLGVARQEADCRALAARLDWPVVAVHTDNDVSAYSGKPRPGYKALLADLEAGRADAVIAWHTDRLHRSPVELEAYIAVCEPRGIPTHCVKAGELDLTTASGRMTARITGAVARGEVERMAERIQAEKRHAALAGHYRGGRRPFGYEADGVTVVPAEAALVADASHRVLRGESMSSLAREWNAAGIASSTGAAWTPTAVQRVLVRPRNAALIECEGSTLPGRWPAIVPEAVWAEVVALCADPSRRTAKSSELRWLGSGLYRCGVCNDDETTVRAATTAGKKPGYRCKRTGHLNVKSAPIDELITALVLARLSAPDAHLLLTPPGAQSATVERLAAQAAALRARNAGLTGLFAEGVITAAELKDARRTISDKLTQLAGQMAGAAAGSPLAGFADAENVTAAWQAATVSRRKTVVGALMTVTLLAPGRGPQAFNPANVRVEWKHG